MRRAGACGARAPRPSPVRRSVGESPTLISHSWLDSANRRNVSRCAACSRALPRARGGRRGTGDDSAASPTNRRAWRRRARRRERERGGRPEEGTRRTAGAIAPRPAAARRGRRCAPPRRARGPLRRSQNCRLVRAPTARRARRPQSSPTILAPQRSRRAGCGSEAASPGAGCAAGTTCAAGGSFPCAIRPRREEGTLCPPNRSSTWSQRRWVPARSPERGSGKWAEGRLPLRAARPLGQS